MWRTELSWECAISWVNPLLMGLFNITERLWFLISTTKLWICEVKMILKFPKMSSAILVLNLNFIEAALCMFGRQYWSRFQIFGWTDTGSIAKYCTQYCAKKIYGRSVGWMQSDVERFNEGRGRFHSDSFWAFIINALTIPKCRWWSFRNSEKYFCCFDEWARNRFMILNLINSSKVRMPRQYIQKQCYQIKKLLQKWKCKTLIGWT